MTQNHLLIRKAFTAWLSALVLLMSVVVPLIERGEWALDTAVESQHNAATCVPGHDHRLCTQVGANVAFVSTPAPLDGPPRLVCLFTSNTSSAGVQVAFFEGNPSRAPPRA